MRDFLRGGELKEEERVVRLLLVLVNIAASISPSATPVSSPGPDTDPVTPTDATTRRGEVRVGDDMMGGPTQGITFGWGFGLQG